MDALRYRLGLNPTPIEDEPLLDMMVRARQEQRSAAPQCQPAEHIDLRQRLEQHFQDSSPPASPDLSGILDVERRVASLRERLKIGELLASPPNASPKHSPSAVEASSHSTPASAHQQQGLEQQKPLVSSPSERSWMSAELTQEAAPGASAEVERVLSPAQRIAARQHRQSPVRHTHMKVLSPLAAAVARKQREKNKNTCSRGLHESGCSQREAPASLVEQGELPGGYSVDCRMICSHAMTPPVVPPQETLPPTSPLDSTEMLDLPMDRDPRPELVTEPAEAQNISETLQAQCAEKVYQAIQAVNECQYQADIQAQQQRREMLRELEAKRVQYDAKAQEMLAWCEREVHAAQQCAQDLKQQHAQRSHEHSTELAAQTALYQTQMDELTTSHDAAVAALLSEHSKAMSEQQAKQQAVMERQQREHLAALAQLKEDHAEVLQRRANDVRAEMLELHNKQLSDVRAAADQELAAAGEREDGLIAKVESLTATLQQTRSEVARVEEQHRAETSTMQCELDLRASIASRLSHRVYHLEKLQGDLMTSFENEVKSIVPNKISMVGDDGAKLGDTNSGLMLVSSPECTSMTSPPVA